MQPCKCLGQRRMLLWKHCHFQPKACDPAPAGSEDNAHHGSHDISPTSPPEHLMMSHISEGAGCTLVVM